ncbi:MAG: ABC transporter ATP-binding protein [Anaerolineales bacterium]|nr:ABC transporter ATP-binding protein [Anaerolineales bacterium]
MTNIVVSIENISKSYQLGSINTGTFYGDLNRWWAKKRGQPDPYLKVGGQDNRNHTGETLWALKNINFQLQQGDVLGVIGRNGAGKSTLLKILSRVTAPTSGVIKVKGRIASLLEVGTGFHPELTGRENIFLNGAILGMQRKEIQNKFDEIVDFSGVEKFIDTPVKRYSSGMYVRLAFAVAAHLEPEILIVDEVLAVGDADFQKKCLGKMGDISQNGRTVIFVSHNMSSIVRLSRTVLLMNNGMIDGLGVPEKMVSQYLMSGATSLAHRKWINSNEAPGNSVARIRSVRLVNQDMQTIDTSDVREKIGIETIFDRQDITVPIVPVISLHNEDGQHIFTAIDTTNKSNQLNKIGQYVCVAWIPNNLLNEGRITVSIALNTFLSQTVVRQAVVQDAIAFQAIDPLEGDSAKGVFTRNWGGAVAPLLEWTVYQDDREIA